MYETICIYLTLISYHCVGLNECFGWIFFCYCPCTQTTVSTWSVFLWCQDPMWKFATKRFWFKLSRCNCINLANISRFIDRIYFLPPNLHLRGRETNKYKWYRYTNWCHYVFTTSRILLRNAFKNSFTAGAGREVLGGRRSAQFGANCY